MNDEVIDVLNIDCSEMLSDATITSIETADGVQASYVDDVSTYFTSEATKSYQVSTLASTSQDAQAVPLADSCKGGPYFEGDLYFELNIDLFKALGFEEKQTPNFENKYDYHKGTQTTVYATRTGTRYHTQECIYASKNSQSMNLVEATNQKKQPCLRCMPPVLEDYDDIGRLGPELSLTGKLGFEEILVDILFEWDILKANRIENLSFEVYGDLLAEIELNANFEGELSGKATSLSTPFEVLKFQGLNEKLLPIAVVNFNLGVALQPTTREGLRLQTSKVPLTCALLIYVDGSGKVSFGATYSLSYSQSLHCTLDVCRDGQWVMDTNTHFDPGKTTASVSVELSGDADIHCGASLMVYIFNLNPVELALFKGGLEAEGEMKYSWASDQEPQDEAISLHCYSRAYIKMLEIRLKLRTTLNFGSMTANLPSADFQYVFYDWTLFELGAKSPTRYRSSEMGYSVVTAYDAENYYFKDTNGHLIRERNRYRTVLFDEPIFTICGIDESYIYILRNNPDTSGTHDIYRVSKANGTNKKIATEVANYLTMDAQYLYYVSHFDSSTILRLDRDALRETSFYKGSGKIHYMKEQGDGFYVVCEDNSTFALFFGNNINYLLLNKAGSVTTDYGTNPSVTSLSLTPLPEYFYASQIVSSGYLRNTASDVYWLSKNMLSHVRVTGVSGWNPTDVGIFTTQSNNASSATPYQIVLYRAEDGQPQNVTDVQSDHAFFTLCQDATGTWYFFDQTADSLILYSMDKHFGNKTEITSFSLSEIPYSLTSCGMSIMNNRIYFYTIPDHTTSYVLYRYDIT